MASPQPKFKRIDVLKVQNSIHKKIGDTRFKLYKNLLSALIEGKISREMFIKFFVSHIGVEIYDLHIDLIKGIYKNALCSSTPPPLARKPVTKKATEPCTSHQDHGFSCSPQKVAENPSALGSKRKVSCSSVQKGKLCDDQSMEGYSSRMAKEGKTSSWGLNRPADDSRTHSEILNVDIEEEESVSSQAAQAKSSPITAPLGVPFCPMSVGSATFGCEAKAYHGCSNSLRLLDTKSLMTRMESNAKPSGVHSVSLNSSNLVNMATDAFLKRMITECVSMASARRKRPNARARALMQMRNQMLVGNYQTIQAKIAGYHEVPKETNMVTKLDFRVAMEMKPQLLGVDWPVQLEKICLS